MADEVDKANDVTEEMISRQIAFASAQSQRRELFPCGVCHYCDCTVGRGALYCDSICRDDHTAELEAKRRNTGV